MEMGRTNCSREKAEGRSFAGKIVVRPGLIIEGKVDAKIISLQDLLYLQLG